VSDYAPRDPHELPDSVCRWPETLTCTYGSRVAGMTRVGVCSVEGKSVALLVDHTAACAESLTVALFTRTLPEIED
jgi:hypothetical protein